MATRSSHPAPIRRRIATLIAVLITALLTTLATSASSTVSVRAAAVQADSTQKPTIVLVHGAFADSSGWNAVA